MPMVGFAAMIEETPVKSRVIEYTDRADKSLAAVCLTDVFDDGLSLVYSFYDPDLTERSLGTHIILDHIAIAQEAGLPYVYLGYWVPGSRKMGYKAGFSALEIYKGGRWQDLGDPADHRAELHPLSVDPIAEQVARINLPDTRAIKD
jgi:leucyl-tRNA---protein transferase